MNKKETSKKVVKTKAKKTIPKKGLGEDVMKDPKPVADVVLEKPCSMKRRTRI